MRIYFEIYEDNVDDLTPGYQEVSCHIIFDVKMGKCSAVKTEWLQ